MTRIYIPVVNSKENDAKLNQLVTIIIIYQQKVLALFPGVTSAAGRRTQMRSNVLVKDNRERQTFDCLQMDNRRRQTLREYDRVHHIWLFLGTLRI